MGEVLKGHLRLAYSILFQRNKQYNTIQYNISKITYSLHDWGDSVVADQAVAEVCAVLGQLVGQRLHAPSSISVL